MREISPTGSAAAKPITSDLCLLMFQFLSVYSHDFESFPSVYSTCSMIFSWTSSFLNPIFITTSPDCHVQSIHLIWKQNKIYFLLNHTVFRVQVPVKLAWFSLFIISALPLDSYITIFYSLTYVDTNYLDVVATARLPNFGFRPSSSEQSRSCPVCFSVFHQYFVQ